MRTTSVFFVVALFAHTLPILAQQGSLKPDATDNDEVVAAIQVHGNTITTTEEVIRASGIAVGEHVSDELLSEAEARLREAIKPDSVDVLKRFSSISDPTKVLILIQLDEGPVRIDVPDIDVPMPSEPRTIVVRRPHLNMMWIPILSAEDGYGLTYGAQLAFTGHRNTRRRVVVPGSWGGDKRIGAEYQQESQRRFAPRLRAGAFLQRRTHPFFRESADRGRVWGRTEWRLLRDVQAGAEIAWQSSSVAAEKVRAAAIAGDVVIDTRVDPLMPFNAVYIRSAVERLNFSDRRSMTRTEIDANGYVGLYRGIVLAVRALHENFSLPAPDFYKSILGGSRSLRGFRAGHAVGDTLVAGTLELRIPATSPLRVARFGYSIFMDVGTAYEKGERLRDQTLERGVGAGVWVTAPLFRFSVAIARGIDSDTRAHIGAGLTF